MLRSSSFFMELSLFTTVDTAMPKSTCYFSGEGRLEKLYHCSICLWEGTSVQSSRTLPAVFFLSAAQPTLLLSCFCTPLIFFFLHSPLALWSASPHVFNPDLHLFLLFPVTSFSVHQFSLFLFPVLKALRLLGKFKLIHL